MAPTPIERTVAASHRRTLPGRQDALTSSGYSRASDPSRNGGREPRSHCQRQREHQRSRIEDSGGVRYADHRCHRPLTRPAPPPCQSTRAGPSSPASSARRSSTSTSTFTRRRRSSSSPNCSSPHPIPTSATLASLATFAIAFLARPIGSALFGHFGDRVGRKTTLVAALLTMGLTTVAIGALPAHERDRRRGAAAPGALPVRAGPRRRRRMGRRRAPRRRERAARQAAWSGMFPQLGAPVGLFFSSSVCLSTTMECPVVVVVSTRNASSVAQDPVVSVSSR